MTNTQDGAGFVEYNGSLQKLKSLNTGSLMLQGSRIPLKLALTLFAAVGLASPIRSEDPEVPGAPRLLPKDTLAYIRIDNVDELREGMADSSMGKMLNDPKLKPFASDIYKTMAELFEQFGSAAGISLDELLAIPSGQVAVAAMPANLSDRDEDLVKDDAEQDDSPEAIRRRIEQKRRQQNAIAGVFIVDAGKNVENLLGLVDKLEARILEGGYVRRTSKVDGTTLVRLLPPRPGRPEIEYFERDDTIVFGIGHQTASKALDHWSGKSEEDSLADRGDFTSVMSRCVGAEDTRPQITFFFDPYHTLERLVKRGGAAALVWPLIEELGIGKIRGMGGSSFRGGEFFEDITHFHVLIDPPRDGFFGVLRPTTGDSTPPKWVPADVSTYTSIHWDFEKTYENLDKVLAKFQGADPLKRFVEEPAKKSVGVSIKEDILGNLTGRYVSGSWIEPPARLNSQTSLYALEIKDGIAAKGVIAKIRDRRPNDLEVETEGSVVIYAPRNRGRRNMPEGFRVPEPGFMILGKWFIFSDSREFLARIVRANAGAMPRLINVPEYELVTSELGGKLDGEKPFLVSFLRGADFIHQMYDLVQSKDTQRFLRGAGESNPIAAKLIALLDRNELPEFKEFEKYFAPSGTFAYDEPSGMHLGSFTLRADD